MPFIREIRFSNLIKEQFLLTSINTTTCNLFGPDNLKGLIIQWG